MRVKDKLMKTWVNIKFQICHYNQLSINQMVFESKFIAPYRRSFLLFMVSFCFNKHIPGIKSLYSLITTGNWSLENMPYFTKFMPCVMGGC